jgi:hypothetical protein
MPGKYFTKDKQGQIRNTVIPAKAGIQNVRDSSNLDSGSPLRSARNDGAFSLSQCHPGQATFLRLCTDFLNNLTNGHVVYPGVLTLNPARLRMPGVVTFGITGPEHG